MISHAWVKRLPAVMQALNSTHARLTGKELTEAFDLKEVNIKSVNYKRPIGSNGTRLPAGVRVRYLLANGELEGGEHKRATDRIWT